MVCYTTTGGRVGGDAPCYTSTAGRVGSGLTESNPLTFLRNGAQGSCYTTTGGRVGGDAPCYTSEFIYSFKDAHKNTEVSLELSDLFDSINEMFKTSTQYLDNKKRVNYNQMNHNKWKLKRKEDIGAINAAYNGFNRLSNGNLDSVASELMGVQFVSGEELERLVARLLPKMMCEPQFMSLYAELVFRLGGRWVARAAPPSDGLVSFRQVLVNRLQQTHSQHLSGEAAAFQGFYHLLGHLFRNKVLSIGILCTVLRDLGAGSRGCPEQAAEAWIIVWGHACHILAEVEPDAFREFDAHLRRVYATLSKRLQFMVMDIRETAPKEKPIRKAWAKEHVMPKEKPAPAKEKAWGKPKPPKAADLEEKFYNYIQYVEEFESTESLIREVMQCHKPDMAVFLGTLLHYTIDNPKQLSRVKDILGCGMKMRCWDANYVKKTVSAIRRKELDDVVVDAPFYPRHLDEFSRLVGRFKQNIDNNKVKE
jgi:hypothetical protein